MQVEMMAERINKFILENFPLARNMNCDDDLLEKGVVDSLGILDIVTFLEREFQVTVTDEELLPENFQSINSIISFVERKNGVSI